MNPAVLAHPEWLAPLALAFAVSGLALLGARSRARRRQRRLGIGAPARAAWRDAAILLAGVAIAVALLGPRVGALEARAPSTGIDVVFLVDVSRSMDARDVPPSRLDRARRAVEEIAGRLEAGDRAALAAFAGRGLLLSPLTPDHDALVELLPGLDTALIEPASSRLGAGLDAATTAFEGASTRPRVIVVASDGEDPDRRDAFDVEGLRALGIRVATIALGSEAGGVVPDGAQTLRDRDGAVVRSRREPERLAGIARETDGEAFVADRFGRIDFARAATALRRDADAAGNRRSARRVGALRSVPFAALAFVLLLVEALPRGVRPRRRAGAFAALAALAALVSAGAHGADAPGREGHRQRTALNDALETAAARVAASPSDARAQVALGLASLDAGRSDDAVRAFQAATVFARDEALAAVAYYDLGVASLARGDRDAARDAFFAALDLDPSDEQARFNLEWTLRRPEAAPSAPADPAPPAPGAPEPPPEAERAEPGRKAAGRAPELPEMSAAQRTRWLERAQDDPSRWLRAASEAAREPSARGKRPAW